MLGNVQVCGKQVGYLPQRDWDQMKKEAHSVQTGLKHGSKRELFSFQSTAPIMQQTINLSIKVIKVNNQIINNDKLHQNLIKCYVLLANFLLERYDRHACYVPCYVRTVQ